MVLIRTVSQDKAKEVLFFQDANCNKIFKFNINMRTVNNANLLVTLINNNLVSGETKITNNTLNKKLSVQGNNKQFHGNIQSTDPNVYTIGDYQVTFKEIGVSIGLNATGTPTINGDEIVFNIHCFRGNIEIKFSISNRTASGSHQPFYTAPIFNNVNIPGLNTFSDDWIKDVDSQDFLDTTIKNLDTLATNILSTTVNDFGLPCNTLDAFVKDQTKLFTFKQNLNNFTFK